MSLPVASEEDSWRELSFLKQVRANDVTLVLHHVNLAVAISVISDFLFSTYPILIFWNVQMALGHKVALCCLMGVGVM